MKRNKYLRLVSVLIWICFNFVPAYAASQIPSITFIDPPYGQTDVNTSAQIIVAFNTKMDTKSVNKNFAVFPQIKGKISWDNNTLIFTPAVPLLPSTSYFVSFTPDIKSKDAIPLAVTYFSTPAQGVCVGIDGNINIVSINGDVKSIPVKAEHPVWASDNTGIMYDYEGQIWQVDTNGKNNKALTEKDPTYEASDPAANPLSDSITFIGTNAAGCANIYSVDTKTMIVRQLTGFFEPTGIENLKWSADGLYLAFLREGQIWIMNQDGKDLRRLTTDTLSCEGNFAWSPGGTKIAFSGQNNIWIGDIYSFEIKKISFDNPNTGFLDWSQDNKIVFESEGVTIMEADGSNEVHIPTAAKKPIWINEGKFFSLVLPLHNQENSAQIWLMSADGKNKEKVAVIANEFTDISWSRNIGYWNLFSP